MATRKENQRRWSRNTNRLGIMRAMNSVEIGEKNKRDKEESRHRYKKGNQKQKCADCGVVEIPWGVFNKDFYCQECIKPRLLAGGYHEED